MPLQPIHVLLVEDDPDDADLYQTQVGYAAPGSFVWAHAPTLSAALKRLEDDGAFDIALLDLSLPDSRGLETLSRLRARRPNLPIVVLTGLADDALALQAVQAGAQDYLVKQDEIEGNLLARAMRYAVERSHAEQKLRESRELNQAILNSLSEHIAVLDHAGDIVIINEAWKRFARANGDPDLAHTGLGVNYLDVCRRSAEAGDGLAAAVLAGLSAVLSGAQSHFNLEYPCHAPHESRWFVLRAAPLVSDHGRIVVAHSNITARKLAEETIRVSERRFRALIENSAEGIALIAADGTIRYESPAATRILGYKTAEMIGRNAFEFLHPDDHARATELFAQIEQAPGAVASADLRYRHQDGAWRWIEATGTNALIEASVQAIVVNYQDITARKQAEYSLRLQSAALEAAANGIAIVDREGRFLWANPAMTRLTGYALEEIIGRTPRLFKSGMQDRAFYQNLWDTILAGEVWRGELVNRRKDGSLYNEEMTITPVRDERGPLSHFVAIKQDVTERKRAEAEIQRRNQELAALNQIGQALSHLAEPDEIFEIVYTMIGTVLDNRNLYMALYDEARQEIAFPLYSMKGERRPSLTRAVSNGLTEYVLRTQTPLLIPRQMQTSLAERGITPIGTGACSLVAVPILVGARSLGVIALQDYEHEDMFNARDVELLTTIASQVAAALDNARLYEAQTRQTAELTAIAQLSAALRTAQTRAEMLPVILDHTLTLFKADGAAFALLDPASGDIVVELGHGAAAGATGLHEPAGVGFSAEVMATGQAQVCYNLGSDARLALWAPFIGHLRSVACVPLSTHGETLGAFCVACARDIQPAELHLLTAIADIAASAIRRESLHEEAQRRAEQLAVGNRLGRALAETLDLSSIYEQCRQAIQQLLPDTATLFISSYDEMTQMIHCLYGLHDGAVLSVAELPPLPLEPPGHGAQSECIRTGQPVIVNDFNARIRQTQKNVPVGTPGQSTQSALYAPMTTKGKVTGVLQVQSYALNRFTEAEANVLSFVANAAAIAIENARLFTETRQQLDHLQALRQIDLSITGSTDLKVTLKVVLSHVTSQLKVDAARVLLLNPHLQSLECAAATGFYTPQAEQQRPRMGDGAASRASLERRTILIPDVHELPGDLGPAQLQMPASEGFVACGAVPLAAKGQLRGVLEVFQRTPLSITPEWLDFLETLAGQAAIAIDNATLFEGLQRSNLELSLAYDATIEGWSRALDLRDKETEGHSQRVTELTLQLARALGMGDEELVHVRRGALLHDIGKMGIPDGILLKPGKLTDEEWVVMRKHPVYAYEMLSPIQYLLPALDIPYCHHERWDGAGYPRGLRGEQIPLAARVFAVVDVWDALRSDRPYRPAWPDEKTREHIRSLSGSHFDPEVVKVFLALVR